MDKQPDTPYILTKWQQDITAYWCQRKSPCDWNYRISHGKETYIRLYEKYIHIKSLGVLYL